LGKNVASDPPGTYFSCRSQPVAISSADWHMYLADDVKLTINILRDSTETAKK
jgi:hypothetical protein